jgi:hypothetical protein
MKGFTNEEVEILKVAIKEFANNTSNISNRRFATWELEDNEEVALKSLIDKFEVNINDEL